MSDYPEHDKMRTIREQSQTIGEFLDWVENEKHWSICCLDHASNITDYVPVYKSINILLAEYFNINLETIENEKLQMLEVIRSTHK